MTPDTEGRWYLNEVFLLGFIDELVVQLQDEVGPSDSGRPDPGATAGCGTDTITHTHESFTHTCFCVHTVWGLG